VPERRSTPCSAPCRWGFIRAEVIAYDDYIALNGEAGAKSAGKLKVEGKEYIVQDHDVIHFGSTFSHS
jgi:ribosome-binding ATPase YchF (GTP1/OBG family)